MISFVLRPGGAFQYLTVLRRKGGVLTNGRPGLSGFVPSGKIAGLIMRASHGEVEQWKSRDQWGQEGHPVTHKIIQKGNSNRLKPSDIIECTKNGKTRRFIVKGVHDPAELGHFSVYFAEEREDLQ